MDIALIGFGYMGQITHRILRSDSQANKIYIIDSKSPAELTSQEKIYPSLADLPADNKVEAVFIASNGDTHADVLKQVFAAGIKNVFCEKPMCISQAEYESVRAVMPKDAKVVVDYILRSSPALEAFQQTVSNLKQ